MEGRLGLSLRRYGSWLVIGGFALATTGALALAGPHGASAANGSSATPGQQTITVTGLAQLSMVAVATVQPQDAGGQNINFSVQSPPETTPQDAIKKVQSSLTNIKNAIASADGTIMSENMNINPQSGGGKSGTVQPGTVTTSLMKYTASVSIQVQLPPVAKIGTVVNTALAAGATGFNYWTGSGKGINWQPTNLTQAIKEAYQNAHNQAQVLAGSMNMQLGSVENATINNNGPYYSPQGFEQVQVTYFLQP